MTILTTFLLLLSVSTIIPLYGATTFHPTKDWFQYAMSLKKWLKNGVDEKPHKCLDTLNLLNTQKPGGWDTFSYTEQSNVFDCMLLNTKLRLPSKLSTGMPMCDLMLNNYNYHMWLFFVIPSQKKYFIDCVTDRIFNYELEDQFESSDITIGGMKGVQWTSKKN